MATDQARPDQTSPVQTGPDQNRPWSRRALRLTLVLLAAPSLWGAQCTPPPEPSCDHGSSCPAGEMAECAGRCVPVVPAGGRCDLDPCAGNLGVCNYNHSCVQGVCVRNVDRPSRDVLFCTPRSATDLTECPTGMYCHLFSPLHPAPAWAPSGTVGICRTPSGDGRSCEGNWAPWTDALACEAGLACVTDPRDTSRHACFRGCTEATSDCPCSSADPAVLDECVTNVPETVGSEPGICAHCVPNGDAREAGGWGCCDRQSTGSTEVCCHPDAATCTSDSDCCPSPTSGARASTCTSSGVCAACNGEGEPYNPKGPGCCFGEPYPSTGVCPVTCFLGTEEVVDGSRCCGTGTVVCRPDNTAECRGAPREIFDCRDNDCNGLVDDGTRPSTCTGEVVDYFDEIANFDGCPGMALPGTEACTSTGELVCRVTTGFCAWGNVFRDGQSDAIDRSGGHGECFRTDVSCDSSYCTAGEWCCGSPSHGPQCQQRSVIDGVPVGEGPYMGCWLPAQLNPDLTCPYDDTCFGMVCEDCLAAGCGYCTDGHVCLSGSSLGPDEASCGMSDWYYGTAMCPRGLPDAGPDAGRDAGRRVDASDSLDGGR